MDANRNLLRALIGAVTVASAISLAACGPSDGPPVKSQVAQKTQSTLRADGDTAITAKVKSALGSDDQLKGVDVSVETKDGNVTLSGKVGDPGQRERVIQIARSVQGVKDVQDSISVN
jgi:hyperosmotically inducible protein